MTRDLARAALIVLGILAATFASGFGLGRCSAPAALPYSPEAERAASAAWGEVANAAIARANSERDSIAAEKAELERVAETRQAAHAHLGQLAAAAPSLPVRATTPAPGQPPMPLASDSAPIYMIRISAGDSSLERIGPLTLALIQSQTRSLEAYAKVSAADSAMIALLKRQDGQRQRESGELRTALLARTSELAILRSAARRREPRLSGFAEALYEPLAQVPVLRAGIELRVARGWSAKGELSQRFAVGEPARAAVGARYEFR